ncbi:MAG: hypothetical protein HY308_04135 [Gammaproteobacteria bacterium]|nr:hypothetical protein [Gammaproteobacteria bacterium]
MISFSQNKKSRRGLRAISLLDASIAIFALSFLGSCGGGGDGGSSRTNPPPEMTELTVAPAEPWINGAVAYTAKCVGQGTLLYEWNLDDGKGTRTPTVDSEISTTYDTGRNKTVTATCIDASQRSTPLARTVFVEEIDLDSVANRTCSTGKQGRGWCVQNPLPTADDLTSIVAIDELIAWSVGNNGTILKTKDGGATWVPQYPKTSSKLNSISFYKQDPKIAWTVGNAGTILKTIDGGATWVAQESGLTQVPIPQPIVGIQSENRIPNLTSVTVADSQTAWAVGEIGTILRTTDGGNTWVIQHATSLPPDNAPVVANLKSVAAADAKTAWAVGDDSTILKTVNGGDVWALQTFQGANQHRSLSSVAAVSTDVAWIVGGDGIGDTILTTLSGGDTAADGTPGWVAHNSGDFYVLRSIFALDQKTAWAIGNSGGGKIIITQDGGQTWKPHSAGTSSILFSVAVVKDKKTAWVVGAAGTILKTSDNGTSWPPQSFGHTRRLTSIAAQTMNTAWAVGNDSTLLKTFDGGKTWIQQTNLPTVANLSSIATAEANVIWAVGQDLATFKAVILNSTNGGATWVTQTMDIPVADLPTDTLLSITAVNSKIAWAVGGDGTIFKTTTGGDMTTDGKPGWIKQDVGTITNTLYSVVAVDSNTAWAVGSNGTILKTTTGGERTSDGKPGWVKQDTAVQSTLTSITAVNSNTAWAVGSDGTILKTTTGGDTTGDGKPGWVKQDTGTTAWVESIAAVDTSTVWASTDSAILKSTTGGNPASNGEPGWTVNFHSDQISSIVALDANTAWVVGMNGFIAKTLTGGK